MASEPNEIDGLLADLKSLYGDKRKEAIFKLADLPVSSRRVVEVLINMKNTDHRDDVREAAARALESPVHQEFLRQNPGLLTPLVTAMPAQSSDWARPAYAALSWQDIWKLALTPSLENYERIIDDPDATPSRARKWVFFTLLIVYPISIILTLITDPRFARVNFATGVPIILIFTVLIAGLGTLGFMLGALFIHWGAKVLGALGDYDKMLFALAAYSCPMSLVSVVLQTVPGLALVSVPVGIYGLLLQLTAVRAVYKLGWGGSCLATLVVPIIIFIVAFLFMLLFRR